MKIYYLMLNLQLVVKRIGILLYTITKSNNYLDIHKFLGQKIFHIVSDKHCQKIIERQYFVLMHYHVINRVSIYYISDKQGCQMLHNTQLYKKVISVKCPR